MSKDNGYIKSFRPSEDDEFYFDEPFTKWQAWHDLLFLAEWKDRRFMIRGNIVNAKRGCVYVPQVKLAERWMWSRNKVTRFLNLIEKLGRVKQQKSNVINCISIVNYKKYQSSETSNETSSETSNETSNETSSETTLNEDNKLNKYITHTARVREEISNDINIKYQRELANNESFIENTCMTLKTDPQSVRNYLTIFAGECMAKNSFHRDANDWRSHFFDWLRIQLEKSRRKKPQMKEQKPYEEMTDEEKIKAATEVALRMNQQFNERDKQYGFISRDKVSNYQG